MHVCIKAQELKIIKTVMYSYILPLLIVYHYIINIPITWLKIVCVASLLRVTNKHALYCVSKGVIKDFHVIKCLQKVQRRTKSQRGERFKFALPFKSLSSILPLLSLFVISLILDELLISLYSLSNPREPSWRRSPTAVLKEFTDPVDLQTTLEGKTKL